MMRPSHAPLSPEPIAFDPHDRIRSRRSATRREYFQRTSRRCTSSSSRLADSTRAFFGVPVPTTTLTSSPVASSLASLAGTITGSIFVRNTFVSPVARHFCP